jgi:uncharacterized protein
MINSLQSFIEKFPKDAMIKEILFEGSDVVVYTKSKKFFLEGGIAIKNLVKEIKKRIDIRADQLIRIDEQKAAEKIKRIVPKEAEIEDIRFEPAFSRVIIYAKKPGLVIGPKGETLYKIKEETLWSPQTKRIPLIKSDIVNKIRDIIHEESKYRQKFLNGIGKRIQLKKGGKDGWVRVTFLGSAREVGRSGILLQTEQSRVLLDCGLNMGANIGKEIGPYINIYEFDIEDLDAVVITHAHMDHCGFLPYLYEYGYTGPTYLTAPTRDLMAMQTLDYIKISQNESGKSPYTSKGIKNTIKHCIVLDFGQVTDITPDMRLTFHNAGHIIGSTSAHIHIGEGLHNLVYSGDFKYGYTRILDPASNAFQRVETLIMESTYGGIKDIPTPRAQTEKEFMDIITKTIKRGGKIIIPSFAVGRAQEVMVFLDDKIKNKEINVPVYLDGMIWDATAIHTTYPEFMSRNIQNKIFKQNLNPFLNDLFKNIGSYVERQEVIENPESCIIITTSGMITGGPIMEYLKHLAEDEKNTLLFVGYQGEGTLGRSILEGWKDIPIENGNGKKMVRINMQVTSSQGFSAHSNFKELKSYVYNMKNKPNTIIINHGENNKVINLTRALNKSFNIETRAPHNLDALRLR